MRRRHRTRHWLEVRRDGLPDRVLVVPNTLLVVGAKEEAKRVFNFGTHAPWKQLVVSSSQAAIDRLSTGLNPEDVVKDLANLLVIDNLAKANVSFGTGEANFTWRRIGIKNVNGVYLLIASIPDPGFPKDNTMTVQYFTQIEYEA